MPRKFHGLKKPKLRQDWSKWNLYNLSRVTLPPAAHKTFFQQKWLAKSMTRAYHGPHVREGQWTRMFDRRLPAVVPMDHRQLASSDGSEFAAGRGSGLEVDPMTAEQRRGGRGGGSWTQSLVKTPYMHMAFHPMERRLDMAIWRAMFASSTKQARQFVVHGWVKVNGKKMIYPSYLLNPGDMFSVDPDRVMFATGAKKAHKIRTYSEAEAAEMRRERKEQKGVREVEDDEADDEAEADGSEAGSATIESDEDREAAAQDPEAQDNTTVAMKTLLARAKRILTDPKEKALSAKRKQELRDFTRSVKKNLSRHRGNRANMTPNEESVDDLESSLNAILGKIAPDPGPSAEATSTTPPSDPNASVTESTLPPPSPSNKQMADGRPDAYKARKDAELLHEALQRAQQNPMDVRKPYATPWQPRAYMSAFAFIPRYLEVNQNICSAVYLRHAVARPGLAEVPTPFHGETMALAFNWYLRRR